MSDPSAGQPNFNFDAAAQGNALPAPSAGAQPVAATPAPVAAPGTLSQGQQPVEPVLSDYAQSILQGVSEADRAVVERYVSQWDAGVQRRVGQLEQTYEPIQQFLGSGYEIDDLATAVQMYDMFTQNPEVAVKAFSDAFGQSQQPQQQPGQPQQYQQPQVPGLPGVPQQQPQFQLPPELGQTLEQMNQFMQAQAVSQQQMQAQQAAQQEDAALDNYMTLLKQEKGDFDENFVMARMAIGIDGADAVDEFNSIIQQRMTPQSGAPQLPAVPVLNGGSAVAGQVPISEASDQQRRAVVTQMLQNLQAQGS